MLWRTTSQSCSLVKLWMWGNLLANWSKCRGQLIINPQDFQLILKVWDIGRQKSIKNLHFLLLSLCSAGWLLKMNTKCGLQFLDWLNLFSMLVEMAGQQTWCITFSVSHGDMVHNFQRISWRYCILMEEHSGTQACVVNLHNLTHLHEDITISGACSLKELYHVIFSSRATENTWRKLFRERNLNENSSSFSQLIHSCMQGGHQGHPKSTGKR